MSWKVETVSTEHLQATLNALETEGFEVFSLTPTGSGLSGQIESCYRASLV